jgi:toxin ParE1/3/4
MANYKLTNKAVADLTNIWNYTLENWSESQADKYYFMLLDNCNEVASNPELGKNYSLVAKRLLGFKAGSWC